MVLLDPDATTNASPKVSVSIGSDQLMLIADKPPLRSNRRIGGHWQLGGTDKRQAAFTGRIRRSGAPGCGAEKRKHRAAVGPIAAEADGCRPVTGSRWDASPCFFVRVLTW